MIVEEFTTRERQKTLLGELEQKPDRPLQVIMAEQGVTEDELKTWCHDVDAFKPAWDFVRRTRPPESTSKPPRMAAPALVRRVLSGWQHDPTIPLSAHCRAAGTTVQKLEAACAEDPKLADRYEGARDRLNALVEQAQIDALLSDPKATKPRQDYLARNGSRIWKGPDREPQPKAQPVQVQVNLGVLAAAPKAPELEDGRRAPLDIPRQELVAADTLPGMEDAA